MTLRNLYFITPFVIILQSVLPLNEPQTTQSTQYQGFYRGTGHTRRVTDLKWITITVDYYSTFYFKIDKLGNISGDAVVRYDLNLDDNKLQAYISYANNVVNTSITLAPGVGDILGASASLKDLHGLVMVYDEVLPIRKGKIKGELLGNRLKLEWDSTPKQIPYSLYRLYSTQQELVYQKFAPAYSPWLNDAVIQTVSGKDYYVFSNSTPSKIEKGTTLIVNTWEAFAIPTVRD